MGERAYQGDETTGFQSPAQDHVEAVPDLADLLELRRPQRYAVRVKGDGLKARGIHSGDILVVNTDGEPRTGKVGDVGWSGLHRCVVKGQWDGLVR